VLAKVTFMAKVKIREAGYMLCTMAVLARLERERLVVGMK
jgi:hypothetical protein